jgi:hypothetical protein
MAEMRTQFLPGDKYAQLEGLLVTGIIVHQRRIGAAVDRTLSDFTRLKAIL